MPPGKTSPSPVTSAFEVSMQAGMPASVNDFLRPSLAVSAAIFDSSADLSSISQRSSRSRSSVLSANTRARQRTEEKKVLIQRREQNRLEQQGRREMARLMRKLRDDTKGTTATSTSGLADVSLETQIGEEQLKWHFDQDMGGWVKRELPAVKVGASSPSNLRSEAIPFYPSATSSARVAGQDSAMPSLSGRLSGMVGIPHLRPPHEHLQSWQPNHYRPSHGLQSYQFAAQGAASYGQFHSQMSPLLEPDQKHSMLQAIHEVAQVNQQLLALIRTQNAANQLVSAQVAQMPQQGSQTMPVPVPNMGVPSATAIDFRPSAQTAKEPLSRQYDPAIMHAYRRPDSDPAEQRHSHALPARPAPVNLSPRLIGIIPVSSSWTDGTGGVNVQALLRESQTSYKTASSGSELDKEAQRERKIRSNAPSPELMLGRQAETKPDVPDSTLTTGKKGSDRSKRRVLQQLSENASVNASRRSTRNTVEGKQAREEGVRKIETKKRAKRTTSNNKADLQKSGRDTDWTAFVQQRMSGMASSGGRLSLIDEL